MSANLKLVLAATATAAFYNLSSWFVPQLEQGALTRFHLSATQAGVIPTAENLVAGVISIMWVRWSRWNGLRSLSIVALSLWFTCYLATDWAPNLAILVTLRVAAGIATGVLIYIASTLAAATARPDRTYSQQTVVANAFAALAVTTLHRVFADSSDLGIYPYAALLATVLVPCVLLQPARLETPEVSTSRGNAPDRHTRSNLQTLALVMAINLEAIMNIANFAFSIPLGLRTGMTEASVQISLGTALFAGTLGALSVSFLPRRAGHALPLAVALLAALASNYITATTGSASAFRVCLIGNQVLGFFLFPLLLGWSAECDPSGRTATLMNGSTIVSGALCPTLAGALIDHYGLSALATLSVLCATLGLACIALVRVLRTSHQTTPRTSAVDRC